MACTDVAILKMSGNMSVTKRLKRRSIRAGNVCHSYLRYHKRMHVRRCKGIPAQIRMQTLVRAHRPTRAHALLQRRRLQMHVMLREDVTSEYAKKTLPQARDF